MIKNVLLFFLSTQSEEIITSLLVCLWVGTNSFRSHSVDNLDFFHEKMYVLCLKLYFQLEIFSDEVDLMLEKENVSLPDVPNHELDLV